MRRSACQHLLCSPKSKSLPPKKPFFIPSPSQQLRHHSSSRAQLQPQNRRNRLDIIHLASLAHTSPHAVQASYTSYTLALVILCGGAFLLDYTFRDNSPEAPAPPPTFSGSAPATSDDLFFTDMPIPQGYRGNLTTEQETKLRELWALALKTFGVQDPTHPNDTATLQREDTAASVSETEAGRQKKRRSRLSIFGGSKKHDDSHGSSPSRHPDDAEDKYGQVKEYQQILATQSPDSIRTAFWTMLKADHPDQLLLRFLRARKWDVDKALAMMVATMSWRGTEMHVDDDVILHGEEGALRDSKSSDSSVKREGHDFLEQMRIGKSFLHGTDKEGRPLCFVRARLHHGGEQTERALERYTVFLIETARFVVRPPVETATILFDMTHFTMANMDYAPVKFMIKVFEANYPESLGAIVVHKAPWIFQGIWKIIKGWLDPVVAAKVHFTGDVKDLEAFIPRSQIIKELGGDEDWEYTYVEVKDGENDMMKDEATKEKLMTERMADVKEYETKTFEWLDSSGAAEPKEKRDEIARRLHDNYWQLDPYVRARSLYDRVGMIAPGGKVHFYPNHEKAKAEVANGPAASTSADDVD